MLSEPLTLRPSRGLPDDQKPSYHPAFWPSREGASGRATGRLGMATRLPLPRREVWPTANADPVRTFAIVVPPIARVRTLVVVPAAEAPQLLSPVLAADELRRALGVISRHRSILSNFNLLPAVMLIESEQALALTIQSAK